VRAARGDLTGGVEHYEQLFVVCPTRCSSPRSAISIKLAGKEKEAAAQYALVEQIARLSALNGALYNRPLALFYADHDMKAQEAMRWPRRNMKCGATFTARTLSPGRRSKRAESVKLRRRSKRRSGSARATPDFFIMRG
jgi:hypothetical protein